MKYIFRYFLILFFIIVLLNKSFIFSYGWYIEYIDVVMGGDWTSIKIDSNNFPHISYSAGSPYNDIKYVYYDGNKWNYKVIEHNTFIAGCTSLELDSNYNPHISYIIGGVENAVKYAYYDGEKWNKEIVYVNEDYCPSGTSLALDSNNRPHISFYDVEYSALMYAYFDGTKWNIETVDYKGNVGQYCSLALDSKDHPHISYDDESNRCLKYAYFDGTKWNIEVVDSNDKCGRCTSIAIDSKDRPHISYSGISNYCPELRYSYWNGRSWVIEVVDNEYGAGGYTSIALDSKDRPHISYRVYKESPVPDILRYAYYDGYKWHIINVDNNGASFISIALDSNEYPHISYNRSIYLYYAYYEGPYPGITLTSFSAKPHNDAITLNWSVSTDEDISGFNLYRRVATPHTNSNPVRENSYSPTCSPAPVGEIAKSPPNPDNDYVWTKVNTSLITGTNPYSYTDRDITPDTNYEYKLEAVVSDKAETLGTTECTSGNGTPGSFDIARIYPTPADDRISIDVIVPEQADVEITIYDITGRKVLVVVSGLYSPGEYTLTSDITGLSDSVYIVKMTSEGFSASKNFVVAK